MKATPESRKRRRGVHKTRFPNVVSVSYDDFRAALERQLGSLGVDWAEFVRQGRRDAFTDDRLRDLWSMVGPGVE